MKKILLLLVALILTTFAAYADELVASVDNPQVVAGEPFDFHLTYSGTEGNVQPDLSVLQNDFQVYSTSTSVQTSFINGVVNQRRDWNISLVALTDGKVKIPEIKAGKIHSKSVELEVLPAGSTVQPAAKNIIQEVKTGEAKFETSFEIDEKNPYIKQEVSGEFIIKDYVGLEFSGDPQFINAEDWVIKVLEQPEVKSIPGGREIKIKFAMFPQKSGELEVPALRWQAYYLSMENTARPRHFGFFDMNGLSMIQEVQKPVILQTKPQKINVKEIPENYGSEWWLPAKALNLTSKWADEKPVFKVGETVVREVVLSAAGVLDSELPELEFSAPEGIKQYPENPQYSLSVYKNEPIAQATYRVVYIPQDAGKIVLPAIELKWYNTKTGKIETATLASQEIEIAANPNFQKTESAAPKIAEQPKAAEQNQKAETSEPAEKSEQQNTYILLAIAFVFGMFLSHLLSSKRGDKNEEKGKTLNKIRRNLKNHDYRRLRDNLIKWGNENFPTSEIVNLNDLAAVIGNENFSKQMQILNRNLYADGREVPDSSEILAGLKNCVKNKKKNAASTEPLPKLYE